MMLTGRMGGWGIVFAGVMMAVGAVPPAPALGAASPWYVVQNIGVLGTRTSNNQGDSEARYISNNGVVAGISTKYVNGVNMAPRAVVWQNGTLTEIGPIGTDSANAQSSVRGISPGGLIAADAYKYDGTTLLGRRGVVWQNGTVTEMPTFGANTANIGESLIEDVSDDGLVVANSERYVSGASKGYRGYTWRNGTVTELPTLGTDPDGYGWGYAWRVHPTTNVIIGVSRKHVGIDEFGSRPVTWHNGAITELPVLSTDADGYASADTSDINTAGVVVGYTDHYVNDQSKGWHATRWTNGVASDLGTLGVSSGGDSRSNAFGINDAGVIIGNSQKYVSGVDKGLRGVVWRDGQMIEAGVLGQNSSGVSYSNMWDLNAAGQAVGTTKKHSASGAILGDRALFIDVDGVTTFIDPPGDSGGFGFSRAQVLTDDGWVFGDYYKNENGAFLGQYAYAWSKAGGLVDLESLLPGGPEAWGWRHLTQVSGMNDLGQIVGHGLRLNGERQGFVLTPVPEPAGALLVGVTMIGLTLSRRRRRRASRL